MFGALKSFSMGRGSKLGGDASSGASGNDTGGSAGLRLGGVNINAAPAWAGGFSQGGSTDQSEKSAINPWVVGVVVMVVGLVAIKWVSKK